MSSSDNYRIISQFGTYYLQEKEGSTWTNLANTKKSGIVKRWKSKYSITTILDWS